MIKKTVTYTDYKGNNRTEDFWFNLSKAELTEMELTTTGGMSAYLNRIVKANDTPSLIKEFKELVLKAYGVKSDDGRRFIKNDTLREEFVQTEAYSEIFMKLATDDEAASEFVNGLIPADLISKIAAENKENHPALKQ